MYRLTKKGAETLKNCTLIQEIANVICIINIGEVVNGKQ
tara:strand:- start:212 stop:328 length:117 start_codon:yes stop_codon:yes gene_type:complete